MLQILCTGCPNQSPEISAQSTVEMCVVAWNREKSH